LRQAGQLAPIEHLWLIHLSFSNLTFVVNNPARTQSTRPL
jgi:hypothetical protein